MNLNDVADGIGGLLEPIGVRASIWRPDPKPPCVMVAADTLTNWTFEDFQEATLTLVLIAGEVGTEAAVRAMNDYLDLTHPTVRSSPPSAATRRSAAPSAVRT